MIKLCINCNTENPIDAVICLECRMSLTQAPTGEATLELKEEMEGATSVILSTEPAPTRLRDMAPVLALVWAGCCTLYVAGRTGVVLGMNPGVPAVSFFLTYAAVPILIPWATVFIAWRWPSIGALMLIAAGLLYLVEAYRAAVLRMSGMCLVLPALLGFLPLAAGVLFLAHRLEFREPRDITHGT